MIDATENPRFVDFMKLVDAVRVLKVRTNADTPDDARNAIAFGAEGIGLFRTEHMFYGRGSEEPLFILRKMILAEHREEAAGRARRALPLRQARHQGDARGHGRRPVTIRLLDPPLHEFVPQGKDERTKLAKALACEPEEARRAGRGAARDRTR